jgi:hypothetical protein
LPQLVPSLNQWGYYGVSHGQHISFFSKKTIKKLGEIVGLRAYSFRNIHLLTERRMSDIELAGIVALARFGGGEMARLFVKSRTLSDNLLLKNIESLSSRGAKNNQITSNEGRCSAAYGGQKL